MGSLRLALGAVAAWEVGWWLEGKWRRRQLWKAAKAAADRRGGKLLVVGEPDGEYPCGDVTIDLRDRSVCPNYVKADVQDLSRFHDGEFASAFASHVLEHVPDPQGALAELHRVAEEVFVAYPYPWRLATYLVPGHCWLVTRRKNQLRFLPYGRCSTHATRYGTVLGATQPQERHSS